MKKGGLFECIKGAADRNNIDVVVMQGDIVQFVEAREGEVEVLGLSGFSKGREMVFTPFQFVEHFKVIHATYTITYW